MSGNRRPLTYLERPSTYQLAFSADGRWIAYVSDQAGEYQVFVESYPAGHGKWQISMHGGAQPVWSRNGRELFFISLQQNSHTIMAVPIKIGTTFESGAPKELFMVNVFGLPWLRRQYSVTPDGQRFLVNVRVDTHRQTILLQNWLTSESK
jgi:serine/threonine-protein kinase